MKEIPLKNKVQKVLTWRWTHSLKGEEEFDHSLSPEKRKRVRIIFLIVGWDWPAGDGHVGGGKVANHIHSKERKSPGKRKKT